ncbi:tRNA (guanine-N1)-methyltransferase [human gut metagenome]|uniref:tRNA (Guanine-N1)-methyltransferase n=1 Tax=human gut metagenome TaxID=408170 RepID=K1RJ47_9ZZZZ
MNSGAESHPITELPKWKRGENVRLVKTEEQFAAAAKLFAEGRRAVCAGNWTEEYCASLTEEEFLAQLKAEKKAAGPATCTRRKMCRTAW